MVNDKLTLIWGTPFKNLGNPREELKMKETDIAYLAGIIDSDGCIGIQKYSNCNAYRVILTVVQRDMVLIEYLYSTFGGSVNVVTTNRAGRRDFYLRWVVTDKKAMLVLGQCLPYLKLKQPQAFLAQELLKVKSGEKNVEKQKEIFLKNKSLNSPATTERVSSLTKEMRQSELAEMKNRQRENRSVLSAL